MADNDRKGCGCFTLAVLGPLIAAIGLAWTMFNVDYMRYAACSEPRIQDATAWIDYCRGFRPVTAAVAQETYDEFLGRASGAQPDRAWDILTVDERAESTLERFEEGWAGILWAERVGVAGPTENRNRFTMQYRVFLGDNNEVPGGDVVYFHHDVEFTDAGSEITYRRPHSCGAGRHLPPGLCVAGTGQGGDYVSPSRT